MAKKKNIAEEILLKVRDPRIILHRIKDASSFNSYTRCATVCDFFGQVGGRPILIECKETDGDSIPYSKLFRDASSHQYAALRGWRECHPHALALYFCRIRDQIGVVPVEFISEERGSITTSHPGARFEDIAKVRLHYLLTGIE